MPPRSPIRTLDSTRPARATEPPPHVPSPSPCKQVSPTRDAPLQDVSPDSKPLESDRRHRGTEPPPRLPPGSRDLPRTKRGTEPPKGHTPRPPQRPPPTMPPSQTYRPPSPNTRSRSQPRRAEDQSRPQSAVRMRVNQESATAAPLLPNFGSYSTYPALHKAATASTSTLAPEEAPAMQTTREAATASTSTLAPSEHVSQWFESPQQLPDTSAAPPSPEEEASVTSPVSPAIAVQAEETPVTAAVEEAALQLSPAATVQAEEPPATVAVDEAALSAPLSPAAAVQAEEAPAAAAVD